MESKTKKTIFWVTTTLVLIGGLITTLVLVKKSKVKNVNDDDTPVEVPRVDVSPSDWPLQKGSDNDNVKKLQGALNKAYNSGLKEDGDWGGLTDTVMSDKLKKTSISSFADYLKVMASLSTVAAMNQSKPKQYFAKKDGTKLYNKDNSVYKTAKKGEWLATTSAKVKNNRIILSDGRWFTEALTYTL
jgi:hypothetical protein